MHGPLSPRGQFLRSRWTPGHWVIHSQDNSTPTIISVVPHTLRACGLATRPLTPDQLITVFEIPQALRAKVPILRVLVLHGLFSVVTARVLQMRRSWVTVNAQTSTIHSLVVGTRWTNVVPTWSLPLRKYLRSDATPLAVCAPYRLHAVVGAGSAMSSERPLIGAAKIAKDNITHLY